VVVARGAWLRVSLRGQVRSQLVVVGVVVVHKFSEKISVELTFKEFAG